MDDAQYPDLVAVAREHDRLVQLVDAREEAAAAAEMHEHILAGVGPLVRRLGGDEADLLRPA